MSDYEKMTGDKKISEIETLIDINGEEKVLVAYNGQNYVISVARLINDGHTHSYTQLNDLQDLMDIVDAQYQHKKDSTLPTESKEVSGAITEIYNLISQLNDEELVNQVEDNTNKLSNDKLFQVSIKDYDIPANSTKDKATGVLCDDISSVTVTSMQELPMGIMVSAYIKDGEIFVRCLNITNEGININQGFVLGIMSI